MELYNYFRLLSSTSSAPILFTGAQGEQLIIEQWILLRISTLLQVIAVSIPTTNQAFA
jgi:hypothetical protein